MNLVGKHFLQDFDDQYRTGRIVGVLREFGMFMVQLDPIDTEEEKQPMPMFIFDVNELVDRMEDGWPVWSLFNTRQELDGFIDSLNNRAKRSGKVIQFRR